MGSETIEAIGYIEHPFLMGEAEVVKWSRALAPSKAIGPVSGSFDLLENETIDYAYYIDCLNICIA